MKDLWNRIVRTAETKWTLLKARNAEQRRRETEVNEAVERVVDQVNPRLRAIGGYRKKLFPVVERTQDYLRELALQVPGPVLVNRQTWSSEPIVNALFGSVERMRWALSGPEVRRYLKHHPIGSDLYAVLAAPPDFKRQLGIELVGETLQKDVRQTALSFKDHEVAVVRESEAEVRDALAQEALELLVSLAVQDILEQESRIGELEERLRIVKLKLRVAATRSQGIGALLDDNPDRGQDKDRLAAREADLAQDLEREKRGIATLDDYLTRLVELLAHPESHLGLELVRVRLDRMNILREGDGEGAGTEIEFTRGRRGDKPARVLSLIRFPRAEVLEDAERLRHVERHLG